MNSKTIGFAALSGGAACVLSAVAAALFLAPSALAQDAGETVAVEVVSAGAVTDPGGKMLGDDCLFQLLCAGENGVPDAPADDGSAGGDDSIFDDGYFLYPSAGTFDGIFNIPESLTNGLFFVRAWNGSSFEKATLYGDSEAKPLGVVDGEQGIYFPGWIASNAVSAAAATDPLRDANGDGIPDAWAAEHNTQDPIPSQPSTICGLHDYFDTDPPPTGAEEGNPARVFATEKFVFVLETYTHRIAVYDRAAGTNLFYYGATGDSQNVTTNNGAIYSNKGKYAPGTGDGAFNLPEGMALDTFSGKNRFAVADTGNSRVQIFSFDVTTGEISFVVAFGTESPTNGLAAAEGTFSHPLALAFGTDGETLLVADTGNYRVVCLSCDASGKMAWSGATQFSEDDHLAGICGDSDGEAGFWVANDGNSRQSVSFHHFSADPTVSFGTPAGREFNGPADVQVWPIDGSVRIAVSDNGGRRLRIFAPQKDGSGAYTGLSWLADIGSASDKSLQQEQKLRNPRGIFPIGGTNLIYAVDTGAESGGTRNRIRWYGVSPDTDGDGMDDTWEILNGLDPTVNDASLDADGDGLTNLGEYLSGCDPQNDDTDGDGKRDMFEMVQGDDPLDPASTPSATPVALPTITADPTEVDSGANVTITATFESAVSGPGSYTLFGADGAEIAYGNFVFDGTAMATASVDTVGFPVGAVSAEFTFAECDPPKTATNALFTVTGGGEPPVPSEEYEHDFSRIDVAGDTVTLTWNKPTENLPADTATDLEFVIGYRPSLSEGDWDWATVPPVTMAQTEDSGFAQIDISKPPFSENAGSAFFKLKWRAKVKE